VLFPTSTRRPCPEWSWCDGFTRSPNRTPYSLIACQLPLSTGRDDGVGSETWSLLEHPGSRLWGDQLGDLPKPDRQHSNRLVRRFRQECAPRARPYLGLAISPAGYANGSVTRYSTSLDSENSCQYKVINILRPAGSAHEDTD
jgi:hypothetical protein